MWYDFVSYNILSYDIVSCDIIQCSIMCYNIMWYNINEENYHIIWYNDTKSSIIFHIIEYHILYNMDFVVGRYVVIKTHVKWYLLMTQKVISTKLTRSIPLFVSSVAITWHGSIKPQIDCVHNSYIYNHSQYS